MGFASLGLLDQAADELEAIAFEDRLLPEVLLARIEIHTLARQWEIVAGVSKELTFQKPEQERGWIAWADALREQKQYGEALDVLVTAEPWHGKTSALLHYRLACYHSLLGTQEMAKERLSRACRMDKSLKQIALDDPDLTPLWNSIGLMA